MSWHEKQKIIKGMRRFKGCLGILQRDVRISLKSQLQPFQLQDNGKMCILWNEEFEGEN